jgi:hypothetical protein
MADAETNWIDFYISLSPVFQPGIWAGVSVAALVILRHPIKNGRGSGALNEPGRYLLPLGCLLSLTQVESLRWSSK